MKKTYIMLALAALIPFTQVTARAEELTEGAVEAVNLYDNYSSIINETTAEDLPLLTIDEAIEKALKNNTSLKTSAASLETAQDKLDIMTIGYTGSGENYSTLLSFLSQQNSIANTKISQAAKEESVKHSFSQSYISIIESQRSIALAEKQLENSRIAYNEAKVKNKMGILSDNDLENTKVTYEKSVQDLENKRTSLELDYISLNIIMGVDTNNRYSFEMPLEYSALEEPASLEQYIQSCINKNPSVIQAENDYDYAIKEYNLSTTKSSELGAMAQGQNNLSSKSLSLSDTKDQLYEQYLTLYNNIKQYETDYATAKKELEVLKSAYEAAKVKYDMGSISLKDLESAKLSVAEKENTIVSTLYSHMMAVEEFENPELM